MGPRARNNEVILVRSPGVLGHTGRQRADPRQETTAREQTKTATTTAHGKRPNKRKSPRWKSVTRKKPRFYRVTSVNATKRCSCHTFVPNQLSGRGIPYETPTGIRFEHFFSSRMPYRKREVQEKRHVTKRDRLDTDMQYPRKDTKGRCPGNDGSDDTRRLNVRKRRCALKRQ